MPARVVDEPLAVQFAFANGTAWTVRLHDLPNQTLVRDLAIGLAMRAHPHGGVGTRRTAQNEAAALRHMVQTVSKDGFAGNAAELTPAVLLRYWLSCGYARESMNRILLRSLDAVTGALSAAVREHVGGRYLHDVKRTHPRAPYTEAEWQRLGAACRSSVRAGWDAHRHAVAQADQGQDPRTGGVGEANLAWLVRALGPLPSSHVGHLLWQTPGWNPATGPTMVTGLREALFPTVNVMVSYRVLFGMHSGLVPDGVDGLGLGDIGWAGDATVLLSYVKGRTGPEGIVLPRRAVQVLQQWLAHSGPLREHTDPQRRQQLWLAASANSRARIGWIVTGPLDDGELHRWVRHHDLNGDDGRPLLVHRGRIRTTYHNLLARRGWTGRTTIDPNHTAAVEGDRYLAATTPAQRDAVEAIIADGQADMLRKALPPVVLSQARTAALVAEYPDAVARLSIDAAVLRQLMGGQRDVFLAACADQLAGLHGPAGKPCPARPWVCLMCPLAIFLPRHAPNLLRLKAFFARQFQLMPTDQFLAVFGPYADRLDSEILPRLDRTVLAAASTQVADTDAELPLRAEEIR
jgi:hypothetical protein